jgi:hypothetical protein
LKHKKPLGYPTNQLAPHPPKIENKNGSFYLDLDWKKQKKF